MNQNKTSQVDFDSTGFLLFLYKWRKVLILSLLIAALGAVIVSSPLVITPKYKSYVVLFPVSTNSISKALLSENFSGKQDILEFGEEEQTEQMLQILNSNKIRDRIIEQFGLMSHYGINADSRYRNTRLYREYNRNISFRRTEYMAVEINVYDKDPGIAAAIANEIASLLDSTKNAMQRERAIKAFRIVEAQYHFLRNEIQEMEDSLTFLRQQGVHDYESQAEMINQQLAIEVARGNQAGIRALEEKLSLLAMYGGPYVSLRDALEHEKKQLSLIKAKYEEAKVDAEQELPQKFVVNEAYPADRKSYPIRWLIVMITLVAAFILTTFVLIAIENIRNGSWRRSRIASTIPPVHQTPAYQAYPEPQATPPPPSAPVTYTASVERTIPAPQANETPKSNPPRPGKGLTQKTKEFMEQFADNTHLLQVAIRWRMPLLVVGLAAAVLASVFSGPMFIKPRFKSTAVLYPANIWPYSDESETEQMLQLLNSTQIRDSIITRFDLGAHYGLKPDLKYYTSTLHYMYGRFVKIKKTEYESVSIEVMDIEPQQAYEMVRAIIQVYNGMVQQMHKMKFAEVMVNYEEVLSVKKYTIDSLKQRMETLNMEYGLLDYASQSREVTRGYLGTVDGAGSRINQQGVQELKKSLQEKGAELLMLQELIKSESEGYSEFKLDYDKALLDVNRRYSHANVISPPSVPDKKAYPIRWLIVAFTTLGAVLLAYCVILLMENLRLRKRITT